MWDKKIITTGYSNNNFVFKLLTLLNSFIKVTNKGLFAVIKVPIIRSMVYFTNERGIMQNYYNVSTACTSIMVALSQAIELALTPLNLK